MSPVQTFLLQTLTVARSSAAKRIRLKSAVTKPRNGRRCGLLYSPWSLLDADRRGELGIFRPQAVDDWERGRRRLCLGHPGWPEVWQLEPPRESRGQTTAAQIRREVRRANYGRARASMVTFLRHRRLDCLHISLSGPSRPGSRPRPPSPRHYRLPAVLPHTAHRAPRTSHRRR